MANREDRMSVKHLCIVGVAVVMGCATSGTSGTSPRRASNILSSTEIVAAHADVNTAYDAVARLRPNWLAAHGVTSGQSNGAGTEYAIVFLDGQQYGDLNSLRNIPAFQVNSIRYYNITEAGGRFGIRGGSSGVIEVTTNIQSRS
jgi:hypothetical protein